MDLIIEIVIEIQYMFSNASYMHWIINRVVDFTAISLLSNLVCQVLSVVIGRVKLIMSSK